jgi:hypothetical protein
LLRPGCHILVGKALTPIMHSYVSFSGGYFPIPSTKCENPRIIEGPSPKKNNVLEFFFVCFYFLCRNIEMGAASCFPSTPRTSCGMARRPVRLVNQLAMARVMYFCSWSEPANLRNREIQTHKTRGMSVPIIVSMAVNFKQTSYMNYEFYGYLWLLSKTLR